MSFSCEGCDHVLKRGLHPELAVLKHNHGSGSELAKPSDDLLETARYLNLSIIYEH